MRLLSTFLLLTAVLFSFSSQAQYCDAGIFYGVSNYQGDLSQNAMDPTEYNLAVGGFLRYHLTTQIAVKGHMYAGTLTGTDYSSGYRARNLHFRSNVVEWGVQGEYSLISYEMLDKSHVTSPYLFAGLSAFRFNPKAEYRGTLVELQELGTEGQGMPGYAAPYKRLQLSIPVGLGIKVAINQVTNIGVEFGIRKTFTDYIDDIGGAYPDMADLYEQRGTLSYALSYRAGEYDDIYNNIDPSGAVRGYGGVKDYYFFGGIMLSINFKSGKDLTNASIKRKAKFSETSYTQRYLF